jgi:hypothetical protein
MSITWDNFHDSTAGSFTRCARPERPADYESFSGSSYWRDGDGVIRESDHWCPGIRSCDWLLEGDVYHGPAVCGRISYALLAAETAAREAEREAAWRARQERRAAEELLKQPGNTVRITRRYSERRRGGRFVWHTESLVCTIAKLTACFLVATDGARFGLHTITSFEAA